jgi:uncharacterized protein (TIGR02246 family)
MEFKLGSAFLFSVAVATACSRGPNDAHAREITPTPRNPMTTENRTKNEAEIRALVDRLVTAIRAKDVNAAMSIYAPDLVAFDIVPPLQYVTAEVYGKRWREAFETFQSAIHYEVRDLRITAGDEVAFSHSLNRISGTMKNGQNTDVWLRWTAGYRKIDGKWLIAHLQASVPVDFENGKAVTNLQP